MHNFHVALVEIAQPDAVSPRNNRPAFFVCIAILLRIRKPFEKLRAPALNCWRRSLPSVRFCEIVASNASNPIASRMTVNMPIWCNRRASSSPDVAAASAKAACRPAHSRFHSIIALRSRLPVSLPASAHFTFDTIRSPVIFYFRSVFRLWCLRLSGRVK